MAAPTAPRHRLLVLDDNTLAALATNTKVVREFPFLAALRATPTPGRGCRCRRSTVTANAFAAARVAVAGLDAEKKRRLKEILDAREVRVVYKVGNVTQKRTF